MDDSARLEQELVESPLRDRQPDGAFWIREESSRHGLGDGSHRRDFLVQSHEQTGTGARELQEAQERARGYGGLREERWESVDWEDQAMAPEEQTRSRALAAGLNLLAVDRPDLLYAAKEGSRRMSSPRNRDW